MCQVTIGLIFCYKHIDIAFAFLQQEFSIHITICYSGRVLGHCIVHGGCPI